MTEEKKPAAGLAGAPLHTDKPAPGAAAAAGLQQHADRGAREQPKAPAAAPAADQPAQFSADQIATPPADEPLKSGRQVQAILGPYAGTVLTMPADQAENAIDDHWAVEVRHPPFDATAEHDHPPLTDEERAHAVEAAQDWANMVASGGNEPVAPARSMHAGRRDTYETRTTRTK